MKPTFEVEVEVIDHGKNAWKTARVSIIAVGDGSGSRRKIGEYERNHAGWCKETFHPFMQNGRWYALYSRDYTATRVMELPSCRDITGEEPQSNGFCPVEYYVPYDHPQVVAAGHGGHFGFVAGCIWGDDSSWKIQHLDLSGLSQGALTRRELFGYVAIPQKASLKDCVSLDEYDPPDYEVVDLAVEIRFDLKTGRHRDQF
jgi:hypothetical protein